MIYKLEWFLTGTLNEDIDKIGRAPTKGLVAKLVEHRQVSPEVTDSKSSQMLIFFKENEPKP